MKGKTVAILASGPSMSQRVADSTRGMYRVAINDTYRLAPDAEMLYAADAAWWNAHPDALQFAGIKVVAENAFIPGVRYIKPNRRDSNSALHATRLAVKSGASEIRLYGVDLRDDELTHWHGIHHDGLANPTRAAFERARAAWERFSREDNLPTIINCSPISALECFPKCL